VRTGQPALAEGHQPEDAEGDEDADERQCDGEDGAPPAVRRLGEHDVGDREGFHVEVVRTACVPEHRGVLDVEPGACVDGFVEVEGGGQPEQFTHLERSAVLVRLLDLQRADVRAVHVGHVRDVRDAHA
jgi:hypothetical protein